jgi:anti-anti-sigma factor
MNSTIKIIQPVGIFDGTKANEFRQEISESIANNVEIILIDFQGVTFMDSSGLGALVLALKTTRSSGTKLTVCSLNEQIRMLFELTSMDRVFEIFPDRQTFEDKLANNELSN